MFTNTAIYLAIARCSDGDMSVIDSIIIIILASHKSSHISYLTNIFVLRYA